MSLGHINAGKKYPMVMPDGTEIKQAIHLKNFINHPRIEVGEFSYYHNFEILEDYASYLAPYLFPISPEKLIIGKFCQFAHGVKFITSSANHDMGGFSTYPFYNFMMAPQTTVDEISELFLTPGNKGDTVVGNDVWVGMDSVIMPGVTVGDGVIIGARSVVTKDVAPYTIVAGSPATIVKQRFDIETIKSLLEICWWNWPVETIEKNIDVITGNDIEALKGIAII